MVMVPHTWLTFTVRGPDKLPVARIRCSVCDLTVATVEDAELVDGIISCHHTASVEGNADDMAAMAQTLEGMDREDRLW